MYGTEPEINEPRFNEILVTTNTIQKRNREIYLDKQLNVSMWEKMNAKQTNKVKIYVSIIVSSFGCLFLNF